MQGGGCLCVWWKRRRGRESRVKGSSRWTSVGAAGGRRLARKPPRVAKPRAGNVKAQTGFPLEPPQHAAIARSVPPSHTDHPPPSLAIPISHDGVRVPLAHPLVDTLLLTPLPPLPTANPQPACSRPTPPTLTSSRPSSPACSPLTAGRSLAVRPDPPSLALVGAAGCRQRDCWLAWRSSLGPSEN